MSGLKITAIGAGSYSLGRQTTRKMATARSWLVGSSLWWTPTPRFSRRQPVLAENPIRLIGTLSGAANCPESLQCADRWTGPEWNGQ